MSTMNETPRNSRDTDEAAAETLRVMGRRSLLKSLAKTGGVAAAASLLPSEWIKPVLDVAVLPAHAQLSQNDVTILDCEVEAGDGYFPSCRLTPVSSGISMTLTILIDGSEVASFTATTDATGDASLSADPYVYGWNGFDRLVFRWSFTNPASGIGTCETVFEEVEPSQPE